MQTRSTNNLIQIKEKLSASEKRFNIVASTSQKAATNGLGSFVSFFLVTSCQLVWLSSRTQAATGTINSFINRPPAPVNRAKTRKQHGKALFVFNAALPLLSSKGRYPVIRDLNRNDQHRALLSWYLRCLLDRQMTHRSLESLNSLPGLGVTLKQ